MAGNDVFLFSSALPGVNDVELNAEPTGGPVGLALAATEGADTAAFAAEADSTPLALAATEGADTAAATVNVTASLAATDGADSAAAAVNVTAALSATDGADSAAASINDTASLAATEGADTAAFAAEADSIPLALAATEGADIAAFTAEILATPATSSGGGFSHTKPRREKPLPQRKRMRFEDAIVLEQAEAVLEAAEQAAPEEYARAWAQSLADEIAALKKLLAKLKQEEEAAEVAAALKEAQEALERRNHEKAVKDAIAKRNQEDDDIILQLFALARSKPRAEFFY